MIGNIIGQHRVQNQNRLLKGFNTDIIQDEESVGLEKSITSQEFDSRYGAGYNVYDKAALDQFTEDALEKGIDQEEIDNQIDSLERVLISKGEDSTPLWVELLSTEEDA